MILGSIALYFILYWLRALLVTICRGKLSLIMPNRVLKMKKSLFFGELITLSLDSYLILVLNSFMVLGHPFFTTNGEVTSFLIAVALTFIWAILIPGMIL